MHHEHHRSAEHHENEPAPDRPTFDLLQLSTEQVVALATALDDSLSRNFDPQSRVPGSPPSNLSYEIVLSLHQAFERDLERLPERDLERLPERDLERAHELLVALARSGSEVARISAADHLHHLLRHEPPGTGARDEVIDALITLLGEEGEPGVSALDTIDELVASDWLDQPAKERLVEALKEPPEAEHGE